MGLVRVVKWLQFINVRILPRRKNPFDHTVNTLPFGRQVLAEKCIIWGIRRSHHIPCDLEADFALVCVTNGVG